MIKKLLGASLMLLAALAAPAHAEDKYPDKPIKLIVPFTPGTGVDNIARAVAENLQQRLGSPVVVDNRIGVAGNLGAKMVGQSPADGYTLLVTSNNLTINANLYPDKDFHAMKDLAPITIGAWGNSTLVASPALKVNTLAELIELAKAKPGTLTYASAGIGSPMHIQFEQFQALTRTKFRHIPYKGTGPALTDLMGGHVDVAFLATHTVAPTVQAGRLKALAVGAEKRNRVLPNVPSFGELGFRNFSTEMWYGFLAPKNTPPAILATLNRELVAILGLPDVKAGLEKTGLEVRATTPAEMATVMNKEYVGFGDIIQKSNIKAQE